MKFILLTTFLAFAAACVSGCLLSSDGRQVFESTPFRLPQIVRPVHYDLLIALDATGTTFEGSVDVKIKLDKVSSHYKLGLKSIVGRKGKTNKGRIVLNANRNVLDIHRESIRYQDNSGKSIKIDCLSYDPVNDNIVVTLAESFSAESVGILHLDFTGKIREEQRGLYRANMRSSDGQSTRFLATQLGFGFGARELFPGFDEPEFKATFQLTVVHPTIETALSNTPVISHRQVENDAAKSVTRFARTPAISSHLLALAVGQFGLMERTTTNGRVNVRIRTPLGRSEEGKSALEVACEAIEQLEDFFGLKYPFENVEFVSVPNHKQGLIGNSGLIFLPDSYLTFNDDETSDLEVRQKAKFSIILALVRSWIGSTISLKWWDDLWLENGLSRWIAYRVSAELYPDDDIEVARMLGQMRRAKAEDSGYLLRADEVDSSEKLRALFVTEGQEKATALLGMLSDLIGETLLEINLRAFIVSSRKVGADFAGFMEFIKKLTPEPVDGLVSSWLENAHHPVFSVSLSKDKHALVFNEYNSADKTKMAPWVLKLKVLVSDGQDREATKEANFDPTRNGGFISLPRWFNPNMPGHFVKVNPGGRGFYQVKYERVLLERLLDASKGKKLSLLDRVDLLADVADKSDLEIISQRLETDGADPLSVWVLKTHATTSDTTSRVEAMERNLFDKFGFTEQESTRAISLKAYASIVSDLIQANYRPAVDGALRSLERGVDGIPLSLRRSVLVALANFGDDDALDKLIDIAKSTSSSDEMREVSKLVHDKGRRERIIEALGSKPPSLSSRDGVSEDKS